MSPKIIFESQRGLSSQVLQDHNKQGNSCQRVCEHSLWLLSQDSVQREEASVPIFQSFPGRGLTAYFIGCTDVQLPIRKHLTSCSGPSFQENERASGHFPYVLPLAYSNNKTKAPSSSWKEAAHMSSAPLFACPPRDGPHIT